MRRLVVLAAALLASAACNDDREPLGPTTPLTYLPGDSTEVNPSEAQLLLAKARTDGLIQADDRSRDQRQRDRQDT